MTTWRENLSLLGRSLYVPGMLLLLFAAAGTDLWAQTADKASDAAPAVRVRHVLGLEGVKRNSRGSLTVQAQALEFKSGSVSGAMPVASIQDVFTGQDSRQVGGKVLTLAKMGVPYGGGRVLSLFSHEKFDSLTLEYRDADGGLHGVVFTMPLGQAVVVKKQLVALGAHASLPVASQPEKQDAGGSKQ